MTTTTKKKILIFSLVYYPIRVGGAEGAIKEITDRLPVDNYDFHMVCNGYDSTFPKIEKIGNVTVHRIGITTSQPTIADLRKLPLHLNKLFYQWQAFWFAKKLHQTEHFDGIWAMMAHATGVPAAKFKKSFPEVKYLLTLQEGDPPSHIVKKMRVFGKAFDDAFVTADMIQVISSFLGDWAKQKGFLGEPILIPNAVNVSHFTKAYTSSELSAVRNTLKAKVDDVLLVTTSRLVPKNGIDDVIKAIALLPKSVKFIIFGNGPYEAEYKQLASTLGVADRVWFRGFVDHDVMPKYLKACDIFIRPSRSEGMGNSFVEAMAVGLPVVATQEGGIADFLFDERRNPQQDTTGWAVDVDSPNQIKKAVEEIVSQPEKVTEVTDRAKKMVVEKYDWDIIAQKMDKEVFVPLLN